MRAIDTYRGFRRNALRVLHNIRNWRDGKAWEIANQAAKLPERARMCAKGLEVMAAALARETIDGLRGAGTKALIRFYEAQRRTRIVSRILRDLEHAAA